MFITTGWYACKLVWVKPELRADGKLYWSADSDSQLTKGLAALLVVGLSGCTPQEILQLESVGLGVCGCRVGIGVGSACYLRVVEGSGSLSYLSPSAAWLHRHARPVAEPHT
eukprot:1144682-Pelagomonas_calceolata.AAC.1